MGSNVIITIIIDIALKMLILLCTFDLPCTEELKRYSASFFETFWFFSLLFCGGVCFFFEKAKGEKLREFLVFAVSQHLFGGLWGGASYCAHVVTHLSVLHTRYWSQSPI